MNKKFLSLALISVATASISVFSNDSKDKSPNLVLPQYLSDKKKSLSNSICHIKEEIKIIEEEIAEILQKKKKPDEKFVQTLVSSKDTLDFLISEENAINTYIEMKHDQTLLNKIAIPARKLALWVASNGKVALALEATGLTGLAYVVYRSLFNPEEDEEVSL